MREEVFRLEQVSIPPVLHDIHLHLYRGEIVALIGLNALGEQPQSESSNHH